MALFIGLGVNLRVSKNRLFSLTKSYSSSVLAERNENEYVQIPEYPQILETTHTAELLRERVSWYDSIKAMATVDEKLLEITRKTFLSKQYYLNLTHLAYKELPFVQNCTNTRIIDGLPSQYSEKNVDNLIERLKDPLLEAMELENSYRNQYLRNMFPKDAERKKTTYLLDSMINTLFAGLGYEYKHLIDAEIMKEPRCSAYWWHKDFTEKPIQKLLQICFQFNMKPAFQIRIPKPISSILDRDDPLCATTEDIPKFNFSPKTLGKGFHQDQYYTMVPGFWPGDACEFPLLSIQTLESLHNYKYKYGERDLEGAIKSMAILGSFGWLMAIAANLGFTPFHELTYPLTTQTILTNGKEFSFFVYQMNTLAMHVDVNEGTHRNLMWCTKPMSLYQTIEDGQFKGVNDEVLKTLISFLINSPRENIDFELRPNLKEDTRTLEKQLEDRFLLKRYFDNRPDPKRFLRQIPTWHHIYKYNKNAAPSPTVLFW